MASLLLLNHLQSPPLSTPHTTTFNNTPTTTLSFSSKTKPPFILKCSSTSNLSPKMDQEDVEEKEQETFDFDAPLRQVWREIQGMKDWKGLIEPTMNPLLRREIIRYGELAQACYDSFDFDPHSKYCGTCKYHPSHFFHQLNIPHSGYTITRYIYATSNINLPNFFQKSNLASVWSPHANWMGYVAVNTDKEHIKHLGRRDILIAWRGTVTYVEWIHDLKDILRPALFSRDQTIKVESGFHDLYTKKEHSCTYCSFSAREQVLSEVKRLLNYYKDEEISITVTGHSLGAALAVLSAYDIAEVRLNVVGDGGDRVPVTVFSFAGPRVGNLKFKERCEELGVKVLRVVNVHDVVPTVPGIITNEKFRFQKYIEDALSFPWSYAHVGTEIALDHTESPFVKGNVDLVSAHNLEVHLHLVDGYHGKEKRFCLASKRDIALVNKSCDFLRSEYGVPPNWRQDENKGMVRGRDGRWVLPERPRLEAHPPDMAHHLQQVLDNHLAGQQLETT
ncbi:phospholipase A1-Igamma3, chloroplastic [Vigna umbellata]|uniref:phospholipase A1-Igamma3, chloroplastic n=1 Tax=Vigna umbellata TaxID=87088 RepID=UPI001F5EC2CD|nr:phospholipase A1-Igamma3, chloroplastic [Vigna umbellata]